MAKILPVKSLKGFLDLFSCNFPQFKENWENQRLSFDYRHGPFIVRVTTPIEGYDTKNIIPLRSQFISFLIIDADSGKIFSWKGSRLGIGYEKMLSARLTLILKFISEIKLCPKCGGCYPFPYLTGDKRGRFKIAHSFHLVCHLCGEIFPPTENREFEAECSSHIRTAMPRMSIPTNKEELEMGGNISAAKRSVKFVLGSNDDYFNPDFKLICTESRHLGKDLFAGSASDAKLECMFFKGSYLQLALEEDHFFLIASEAMDCMINGVAMITDTPFKLYSNINYNLRIDDITYRVIGTRFKSR